MAKRPTIVDLAREAGVSVATVDRVLNRRLPVREGTALRVVSAAEAIGYHATGLLKQRITELPQRTFGFILQKRGDVFYRSLADHLVKATKDARDIRGRPIVEFVDELAPALLAGKLRDLARKAHAIGIVAVEHPHVTSAIEELAEKGVPVFALLSDLSAASRAGYFGVDSRKCGRTAAWTISRLARAPGKVAVLVGSHSYLNQETSEISFRTYLRHQAPEFTVLETIANQEDNALAYASVRDLLREHKDLCGIYNAGGGEEGFVQALREHRNETQGAGRGKVIAVCNEFFPDTRSALIEGVIDMVLSTPLPALAARAIEAMTRASSAPAREGLQQIVVPPDLYISETI